MILERKQDQLTFVIDERKMNVWLGVGLATLGCLATYGTISSFGKAYIYKFGMVTDKMRLGFTLLGAAISLLLLFGGVFNLTSKEGITFDRRRKKLSTWSRRLFKTDCQEYSLNCFQAVRILRQPVFETGSSQTPSSYVYPVELCGLKGEGFLLHPYTPELQIAENMSMEISKFIELPIENQSHIDCGPPIARYQWKPQGHFS